jgi:predicted Holliday junction resolvase-like endonuclease
MTESLLFLALGLVLGFLLAWLYAQLWKARHERALRKDAVKRSAAVTTGKVVEQLVPWLPGFPFNPRDARFLGAPVDFVVFEGLNEGDVRRVAFVEVKTGSAQLTPRERQVRAAVEAGRVAFVEYRPRQAGS